ncbi:MAG: hypothetical protein RLZZ399_21 [Verrucomicrobiota bacterium]
MRPTPHAPRLLCALSLLLLSAPGPAPAAPPPSWPKLAEKTADGFLVPQPNPQFQFPKDHGSHPDFKVEWWYLTGHLFGPARERFGFQATFFRRAGMPPSHGTPQSSRFRTDEIHLFHAALLDAQTGKFLHHERLARAGWEASSSTEGLHVRLGDSSLTMPDPAKEQFRLESTLRGEAGFSLLLEPLKSLVIFGKEGVSRKGNSETAASWYLTYPRLQTKGEIRIGNRKIAVTGQAWMDHEISSSQLTGDQAGWDWAGIQLEDGREIMTYRLRKKDGSADPASSLTWVDTQGKLTHFGSEEFRWEGCGAWKSPGSGASYPLPVELVCPDPTSGKTVRLTLQPIAFDQELRGKSGLAYWEGACRVWIEDKPAGSAYVELTGYSGDLSQGLR